ncbi:MAG TPA: DUF4345 domain-containing protein [Baekduia sp.]|nr:DUF4345 domain-containing protein [Baekduia sp.]
MASARALRRVVRLGGVVATAAGLHTMAAGAGSVPGRRAVPDRALDSELRFYGTYYAAFGLALVRLAPRAHLDSGALRAAAATVWLAGAARAGGWRRHGPPTAAQQALLAIELIAPPVVAGWQARLLRSGATTIP